MFDEEKQIIKNATKQIVNACVKSVWFWMYAGTAFIVFIVLFLVADTSDFAPYIFRQIGVLIIASLAIAVPLHILPGIVLIAYAQVEADAQMREEEDYYRYMPEDVKEAILDEHANAFRMENGLSADKQLELQNQAVKTKPTINRRKGYVYVVNEINGDHYKIGRSGNPNNRVRTFGVKLPYRIDIDILIPTDDMYALEAELHTKFADKRVDGEWFALTPEDIDWIRNEYETEEDKES